MNCRINSTFSLLLITLLGLSVTACSHNQDDVRVETKAKKAMLHTHPANKCIDSVSHAHPKGNIKHLHHYHFCKVGSKKLNAHSHPSSSIMGFTRHVHPNGANPHSHGG
jgi:hypothetical protein